MNANPILLQMKYARVISRFAALSNITKREALSFFYHSKTYELLSEGVSDMHCMSDQYLAEDLYFEKLNGYSENFYE